MRVALSLCCLTSCLVTEVLAWGAAGHEIVAVIAQIHLFPSTKRHIANILPPYADGSLARVAAWADRVRYANPWSGQLHYVSPLDDHPPTACSMTHGWRNDRNVFSAIANYSERISSRKSDEEADIDLRFLVHFMGDVHQPLHLMERERGGNGDPVLWEGRHMSLHGLWDSALLARAIRDLHNYTSSLPSRQIEDVLRGSIYDSYVRWILWEGVRRWWKDDLVDWLACSSTLPAARVENTDQLVLGGGHSLEADFCPTQWANPIHQLTCSVVFPDHYDDHQGQWPPNLSRTNYYHRLQSAKVVESLLAKAGLRLAASLNLLLADADELHASSSLPVDLGYVLHQRWYSAWR